MAHQEQIDFCLSVKKKFPEYFINQFVLDIGSLDVNGNNQYLFEDCHYLGLDLAEGKNVDILSKGHELLLPDTTFDVVISTECFEHDPYYKLTLNNAIRLLKQGGLLLFSCATTGRPEHGTRETTPSDAPFLQAFGEWADYYKNLEQSDIQTAFAVDELFSKYEFSNCEESHDLYFWGIKKGTRLQRIDYSFQVAMPSLHVTLSQSQQIVNLKLAVNERKITIDKLNQQNLCLKTESSIQVQSISKLNRHIDDLRIEHAITKNKLDELTKLFYQMENSYSWRCTKPLRFIARRLIRARNIWGIRLSWLKFLFERSQMVIRHQGIVIFIKRVLRYINVLWRRQRSPSRRLNNFQAVDKNILVSFIIPIYDRTDMLRTAIRSALDQTVRNIEVILVTDGSPEETLSVVNEFSGEPNVRIFNYPCSSGNAVRGRNKGISEARGRYIAFLDSDDMATQDRLDKCLPLLESGQADVVYGSWQAIMDGGRVMSDITDGQIIYSPDADFVMLLDSCIPCQSTVILRKDLFEKAGFLKTDMQYREDHELWVRLAYFGAVFKSVPNILTKLRLHSGNNELNFKDSDNFWFEKVQSEYMAPGPRPKKIAFILPGVGISGGIAVVFKHAELLFKAGHDVFIINIGNIGNGSWFSGGTNPIPIVHVSDSRYYLFENIDLLFATGWDTVSWLECFSAQRKLYFVQSDERRFFDEPALKQKIHETYLTACEYLTEALWIKKMLCDEFGHESAYVPNGIDMEKFYPGNPLRPKRLGKVRVLLEGPIVIPFKGVADSYAAIEKLDCEIWIVSSAGKPPESWRYDSFFESVPFGEMRQIYASCDIFLKMSRIEGFFGPPMEAMACGCAVVVGKVTGYDEYIIHEQNALVVEQGDVQGATNAVERLIKDVQLRQKIIQGGFDTVPKWSWERSAKAMLSVAGAVIPSESNNREIG